MASVKVSEYMITLMKELMEQRKVSESTANAYMKSLYILNGKAPFKSLTFLRKKEPIMETIRGYADNTQKSILGAVVSVLSVVKDKPAYKSIYKFYYEEMMGKSKAMKENGGDSSEKTEKQKENWVSWEDVKKKVAELREEAEKVMGKKTMTATEYEKLLHYVILSLYTYIQPRRNQDYLGMVIVKKWKEDMPADKNYLDLAGKQFIFNKYKTAKKYGTQKIAIPESEDAPLYQLLALYTKHHPLYKQSKGKEAVPFLVSADGKPFTAVNAITRVLNRIFGKRVGSSMLRHVFLSDKYDISEMEKDAKAMGHSVEEQKKYMKTDGETSE